MCGIIGLLTREKPILPSDIERMRSVLQKIAYRGPDGMETWNSGKTLLGHRRLSIIDLSPAGAQPFIDHERQLVITFNGEIYNFRELRETLESLGYMFYSNTDTEVILYAYDYFGSDFLSHLNGMFAFCLFDEKRNIAILARDPAGEKPLYYYLDSQKLIFSSEIKAFHAFSELDLSIDEESVRAFFALQYIPGPHTVYRSIRRLHPGSAMIINLDQWTSHEAQYWSVQSHHLDSSTPDEIDALLSKSVCYRLIADVEVGLLLSGGIDSALLASYARQHGSKLRTFTARFEQENLDELKYAQQVANHLDLEHIVITGGQVTPEIFDKVIFHGDELLGDPACIPTFLLSHEISKYVKVVLSGEGADELFLGYDTYRFEKAWRRLLWARSIFSNLPGFRSMIGAWDSSNKIPPAWTRLGKLLAAENDIGAARWTTVYADYAVRNLVPSHIGFQSGYLQEIEQRIGGLAQTMDPYEASLTGDLLYWLPDDLLMKVDRMTMAHGVEARAPYLAPDLIPKALALPQKYKLRRKTGKIVLRGLVEKYFPGEIGRTLAWRKKHGFEVPVNTWLRDQLRGSVEDRLSPAKLAKSGLIDVSFAMQIKKNFYQSHTDTSFRRKLWLLLCFQTWYEMHETSFGFR